MKTIYFFVILSTLIFPVSSQKLLETYKKGVVKLIPDADYGKDNNWDVVFKTYYDTLYNRPMGNRKSLIVMPDGSVVVNNQYRNFYTKFSPTGKFEKEFGVKNSKGTQFKKINNIGGIINNNTFFAGPDNMGNMVCFDFNGNYKKTLKLNYMTSQIISLPNGKFAVVGWAIWAKKFRDFVSIVDYATNLEKVIWEHYTEKCDDFGHCKLFQYGYKFKDHGAFSINTMPFSNSIGMSSPPIIAYSGNLLIVSIPSTGEILKFNLNGILQSKDKIEWTTNYLSVEEQKKIQQKAIDKYKSITQPNFAGWVSPDENKLALQTLIGQMEEDMNKIDKPLPIPTFSTIINDSEGNLLYFEFPKEENGNKFHVWIYKNNGKFVCQSSFICNDYDLEINPYKMAFYKGYLYSLQRKKNVQGVPLRLVRFKIAN